MIGKRSVVPSACFLSLLVCLFCISLFVRLFGRLRVCVFVRSFVADLGVVV